MALIDRKCDPGLFGERFEVVQSTASQTLVHPEIRFIAPGGSLVRKWQGYIGPAEIGLAGRRVLGEPTYSQMKSEDQ